MSEVGNEAAASASGNETSQSQSPTTMAKKDLVVHADEASFIKKASPTSASEEAVAGALQSLSESFKGHLDKAMAEMKEQSKQNTESILAVMQQESAKRTALEQRLHSQLLLQNEYMVAMELKLLRLEAKVERRESALMRQQQHTQQLQLHNSYNSQQQRSSSSYPYSSSNRLPSTFTTINESALEMPHNNNSNNNTSNNSDHTIATETAPPNMAVISSGASLASGVTAGSFLAEDGDEEVEDSGNPVTREIDEDDTNREGDNLHASEQSTPTQGSRPRVTIGESGRSLESILLNPMIGESNFQGLSVRATRGPQDTDGNSSLATSVTNSTVITNLTSTTRGELSTINVRRYLPEEQEESEVDIHTPSRRGRSNHSFANEDDPANDGPAMNVREEPRSRSQSPLTVATHASETLSMASASTVGTSIRSSVAVAPRGFGQRSRGAAMTHNNSSSHNNHAPNPAVVATTDLRPLPDRVVSFTPDLVTSMPYSVGAADSITMPDELDNISEVADTFANTASAWREEYEARLDALHKRWSNE